ncbi:rho-N domain-containing protein 1, chloroplastic-like isoform X2 [Andrographis paniculata]|uniref:rho-N domain-containing protein 1, chloroplastic-like isoform X2 n=1 Tax=Andrographis paniculata TaxID=175694 RepID=UPI0021E9929D|nr:rho-N domain-containing protein 1, chloroplastic-like isoform X2 [Andrographis paniculata]
MHMTQSSKISATYIAVAVNPLVGCFLCDHLFLGFSPAQFRGQYQGQSTVVATSLCQELPAYLRTTYYTASPSLKTTLRRRSMSGSVHCISRSFSGCETPFSGASGKAAGSSIQSSLSDCTLISNVKFSSLKYVSGRKLIVCNANSGSYRRNPDFSRQNRQGFRSRNTRFNERRDDFNEFEESEVLISKNGPSLAVSGNQKSQGTMAPGNKEREIVELFRKVQTQLRERAATKEEKEVENSEEKSHENGTVDSLLRLLRRHSVQKGKINQSNNAGHNDFVLDHHETNGSTAEQGSTGSVDLNAQENMESRLSRPKSSFRKRSPVPETKFQPAYFDNSVDSAIQGNGIHEVKMESDDEEEQSLISNDATSENAFDEISEDENAGSDGAADEAGNLSGLKLTELRALAKSSGIKGFSKLKKQELIEILSSSSSLN